MRWPSLFAAACLSLGVMGLGVLDAKPPVAQKKIEKAPVDPKAEAAFREQAKKLSGGTELDKVLSLENKERGIKLDPMPVIDDLTFLRRVYCDLISRIPSVDEVAAFEADSSKSKRAELIDNLIKDGRFVDRWTVFYADMFRLRAQADGGGAALAWVHQAVAEGMPHDEICRRLITTNGKAGAAPEVAFVLGDNADPMALAGVTSQVFMGVRVSCAQCHDHPFDVWTQENFYGFAAYFGKTKRVENQFTRTIYANEGDQSVVLWPPEGKAKSEERKPMKPSFPFEMTSGTETPEYIVRLNTLRAKQKAERDALAKAGTKDSDVDDLLAEASENEQKAKGKKLEDDITKEAKKDAKSLNIKAGMYATSEWRQELANLVTSPRNRFFAKNMANRVWADLVGRGIVDPIDDFSDNNPASHPKLLDYLADEFVASGFDLRSLVSLIVNSDVYQRAHVYGAEEQKQTELEKSFLATPMRRMLSETLYDSIVTAGHLSDVKHVAGKNMKTTWRLTQVVKPNSGRQGLALTAMKLEQKMAMNAPAMAKDDEATPGADVEKGIELDFGKVLAKAKEDNKVEVEEMRVMSKEEIEAERMRAQMQTQRRGVEYIDRYAKATFDDNPRFGSSLRMASPAVPEHFLRVFGQTDREILGENRDHAPNMRQALMMLNGTLTHEASRVGELEPMYSVLAEKKDLDGAVRLAYREILTREPSANEVTEAKSVIKANKDVLNGMADFRWILLNCNEFRFLP
ncbi:MAG: DUF1553 domain-containing protein [Planctomycetia bacterium]|nr:DUF1553 domain-containing protein [Planctomycetia bacterium]